MKKRRWFYLGASFFSFFVSTAMYNASKEWWTSAVVMFMFAFLFIFDSE